MVQLSQSAISLLDRLVRERFVRFRVTDIDMRHSVDELAMIDAVRVDLLDNDHRVVTLLPTFEYKDETNTEDGPLVYLGGDWVPIPGLADSTLLAVIKRYEKRARGLYAMTYHHMINFAMTMIDINRRDAEAWMKMSDDLMVRGAQQFLHPVYPLLVEEATKRGFVIRSTQDFLLRERVYPNTGIHSGWDDVE